jgi:AraC family transcriptional regulator, L-rhamnose operon transcriptional activator RhaR
MENLDQVCCKNRFFRNGENFFINRIAESVRPHLHCHDCIEIAYISSGEGIHYIAGESYRVHKGDLFIINCGVPHEFKYLENSITPPLIVYNCIFTANFLDKSLPEPGSFNELSNNIYIKNVFSNLENSQNIKVINKHSIEIEELFERMLKEYSLQNEGYVEIIRLYIMELIVKIFRLHLMENLQNNTPLLRHHNMLDDIIIFIKSHLDEPLTVNDLAIKYNYSPSYFSKLFKTYTGMPLTEYIQKMRIERACSLLRTFPDKSIERIANEVGYCDMKFFNKIFRRISGKTPTQVRNEIS